MRLAANTPGSPAAKAPVPTTTTTTTAPSVSVGGRLLPRESDDSDDRPSKRVRGPANSLLPPQASSHQEGRQGGREDGRDGGEKEQGTVGVEERRVEELAVEMRELGIKQARGELAGPAQLAHDWRRFFSCVS